eukprot:410222_1
MALFNKVYDKLSARSTKHYLLDQYVHERLEPYVTDMEFMTVVASLKEEYFTARDIEQQTILIPSLRSKAHLFTNNTAFNNKKIIFDVINERYKQNVNAHTWVNDTGAIKCLYGAPLTTESHHEGLLGVFNGAFVRDFPFYDYNTKRVDILISDIDQWMGQDEDGSLYLLNDYQMHLRRTLRTIENFPVCMDIMLHAPKETQTALKCEFYCRHVSLNEEMRCKVAGHLLIIIDLYIEAKKRNDETFKCELYLNEYYCRHVEGSQPQNPDIQLKPEDIRHWKSNYSAIKTFQDHLMHVDSADALAGVSPNLVNYQRVLYQIRK